MPSFKVAHLREQGQDMVIVPLASDFGSRSRQDQQDMVAEMQRRCTSAGLRGTVVPVWERGGVTSFIAPTQWHPFFRSMPLRQIWANVNREVSW